MKKGEVFTWEVRAPDLEVGDDITLGWGGENIAGRCPCRRLVGGHLCLDIASPAWVLQRVTAVEDPLDPNAAVAQFSVLVPRTARPSIFLQAISAKGRDSATSNVLEVSLPNIAGCGASELVNPTSQADIDAVLGCGILEQIRIDTDGPFTKVELPLLHTVRRGLSIENTTHVTRIRFPRLTATGTLQAVPVTVSDNSALEAIEVPERVTGPTSFNIQRNPLLPSLDLRNLQSVTAQLAIQTNPLIRAESLPAFVSGQSITLREMTLDRFSFPLMTHGSLVMEDTHHDGDIVVQSTTRGDRFPTLTLDNTTGVTSVGFPNLALTSERITIKDNADLVSVDMPLIPRQTNAFVISGNPLLETADFGSLSEIVSFAVDVRKPLRDWPQWRPRERQEDRYLPARQRRRSCTPATYAVERLVDAEGS